MRITITPEVYVDQILAIDVCPVEIQWSGVIEKSGEDFRIKEIIVFPQECSGAGTELDRYDPNSFRHYWSSLMREGRSREINNQHLWGHSHVWMPARFSFTDDDNIERFGDATTNREEDNPWWISIVGNKYHKLNVRFDRFKPRRYTLENMPLFLADGSVRDLKRIYPERRERMREIIESRVRFGTRRRRDDDD